MNSPRARMTANRGPPLTRGAADPRCITETARPPDMR